MTQNRTLSRERFGARQYVIAPKLTGTDTSASRSRAQNLIANLQPVADKKQHYEYGSVVVEMTAEEAAKLRQEADDQVIVTPLIKYSLALPPTFPTHARQNSQLQSSVLPTRTVEFFLCDRDGSPIPKALIVAFFSLQWKWGTSAQTDVNGVARLPVPESNTSSMFEVVRIYPPHSCWPIYQVGVPASDHKFILEQLPPVNGYQWWAELLGVQKAHFCDHRGQNVKVAVIDTGVGPHPDLGRVRDGRNFTTDGGLAAYEDVDGHGTHVAGIIAAEGNLVGIAPDTEIYAARVFPKGADANNDDIAEAIEVAVDEWHCDIINLSLGGPYDPLIENRINYATQRGVLCVAAAGNSGGPVEFPAALRDCFSIAAIGCMEIYPEGSIHETAEPDSRGLYVTKQLEDLDYDLYAAKFTCNGEQVQACAPGVAIISTVPPCFYAALDGTSMACPMAAGVAAILLSKSPTLRTHPRNAQRTAKLKTELKAVLKDIRLPRGFQGGGLISL